MVALKIRTGGSKPSGIITKSGAVPLEDLDQCASAIAEREHTAGIRVEVEFQFDDRGQAGIDNM